MGDRKIVINRAPVLTLWAAVVAERLYEQLRPAIPEGVSGWGAKGELDLERVRSLAEE
jgi:hypothetical protein